MMFLIAPVIFILALLAIWVWPVNEVEDIQAASVASVVIETPRTEFTWAEFHLDAFEEYASEFDALFNSYETKWSKNGRLMMRKGSTGSFKFVSTK